MYLIPYTLYVRFETSLPMVARPARDVRTFIIGNLCLCVMSGFVLNCGPAGYLGCPMTSIPGSFAGPRAPWDFHPCCVVCPLTRCWWLSHPARSLPLLLCEFIGWLLPCLCQVWDSGELCPFCMMSGTPFLFWVLNIRSSSV